MEVTITDSGLQQPTEPLTAVFEGVPSEHDGTAAFALDVRFSEALGATANAPAAASFAMQGGRVKDVRKVESGLWRVRVKPKSWKDMTVTLAGGRACDAAGAVCTADDVHDLLPAVLRDALLAVSAIINHCQSHHPGP